MPMVQNIQKLVSVAFEWQSTSGAGFLKKWRAAGTLVTGGFGSGLVDTWAYVGVD